MELVRNCLKVQGGIIVPVYNVEAEEMKRLSGNGILVSVKSYGLEVRIDEIVVPIPEFMLEFVIDNNAITFYRADNDEYMWEPLLSVEIPRDDLIEARGAYKFIQNSNLGENKPVETAAETENWAIRPFRGARYCTLGVSTRGLLPHPSIWHRHEDDPPSLQVRLRARGGSPPA